VQDVFQPHASIIELHFSLYDGLLVYFIGFGNLGYANHNLKAGQKSLAAPYFYKSALYTFQRLRTHIVPPVPYSSIA